MKPNDAHNLPDARHSIRSKLNAPLASSSQILRRKIYDRVVADEARLVLIRGPAGFGKTTVMLQLRDMYQQAGAAISWLTLDDADNDVSRFLYFLSRAIKNLAPAAGLAEAEELPAGAISTGDFALDIIDRIAQFPDSFAVFIDDFETISNPVALGLVARIVESVPGHGRIVIGSRNVPEIGLGRLRAKAYVSEVDPGLLRFSVDETSDFLRKRKGLSLSPDQVFRLHQNTEGWITALSLASMGLERGKKDADSYISGFSGSDATIVDYLAEDVLARLPDELRDFLLKSSILDELNDALCNLVCSCSNSQLVLQQLERANLFLAPLDEERKWYRYHTLFRGFLRTQLARQYPAQLGALHRAAADWYLAQNRPIPAINHALSSADYAFAIPLLESYLNSLLEQGRFRLLARWIGALPRENLQKAPQLRIAHAWAVNFTRGGSEALALLDGLDADQLDAEPQASLRSLRAMILAMLDRIDESFEHGMDALPAVPSSYGFAHGMLAQALTHTSIVKGRFADAHKFADQARRAQEGATGQFNMVLAESAEATMDLMQGRLRQAAVRLRSVADAIDPDAELRRYGNAFSGILFAETLYELDECEQAQKMLEVYVSLARELAHPNSLISSHVLLTRIVSRQGDLDRALHLLTELETTGHRLGLPRVVASARLERAYQALLQNDVRNAKVQLDNAGDAEMWSQISRQWFISNDTATLAVGQLRWMIRSGASVQALPILKKELEEAELGQRHRRALKIRILMVEALHRDGQHKLAMRTLARALEFAIAEGFIQTFLEEGEVVETLLNEWIATRQASAEGIVLAQEDWLARLRRSNAARQKSAPAAALAAGLAEALTRKELQVLELLAQGLSNNDMADRLFCSESTVRTHLRNINAKLQASNRMQAVAIARQLHLVQ